MAKNTWPPLPLDSWRDTRDTLQMWTQIAGKICLALTPRVNHFWDIAFQVTPRGLVTPALPHAGRTFTMTFDFIAHELAIDTSDGLRETIPLRPQTVADFYRTRHGQPARDGARNAHLDDAGRVPGADPLRAGRDAPLV